MDRSLRAHATASLLLLLLPPSQEDARERMYTPASYSKPGFVAAAVEAEAEAEGEKDVTTVRSGLTVFIVEK